MHDRMALPDGLEIHTFMLGALLNVILKTEHNILLSPPHLLVYYFFIRPPILWPNLPRLYKKTVPYSISLCTN